MAVLAECLRCGRAFEPRKRGHYFCSPRCRHAGPRREDEPAPPSQEVIDALFDPRSDPDARVEPSDWHPRGGDSEWAALDWEDTLAERRRWFEALRAEGGL